MKASAELGRHQQPTIYQLAFACWHCQASVTLNGFKILEAQEDREHVVGMPVNSLLVGTGNRLLIRVTGKGEEARMQASVETVLAGEVVEIPGVGELTLPDGDLPLTIEKVFDSPVDAFRKVLHHSRVLSDEEVLDFGIQVRDLLRDGDRGAVEDLYLPQVEIVAEAFAVHEAVVRDQLAGLFELMLGSDLAFERDDLEVISHCDRRVCEVRRGDGRSFIFKGPDSDGGTSNAQVFVADLGDGLRVVR